MLNISSLRGHETQRNTLFKLVEKNKLPQTLLFIGAGGIGKRLVAFELASALLCRNEKALKGGCKKCAQCKLIESENHPDLLMLDFADRESSNMEELRIFLSALSLAPYQGGNRVIIFDHTEQMIPQAANLLLKTLEEPREHTYFILLSANKSRILPTIVSRAQCINFGSLSKELISELSKEDSDELIFACDGSFELLKRIKDNPAQWEFLSGEMQTISSGILQRGLSLSQKLAKDRDSLRNNLSLLQLVGRTRLHVAKTAAEFSRWAVFQSNVLLAEQLIFNRNLNATLVLDNLFLSLHYQPFPVSREEVTLLERIVV